jgi:carboxymethylenebutenolidase
MPTITDTITTPDGSCPVTLAMPDGAGPWPGIVMYPDAGGVRPALQGMAARLAALGYAVLLPDVYYRNGVWAPFDMVAVFGDAAERNRLFALMKAITPEVMAADAQAFFDYLAGRSEVAGDRFGTTGYCMGGRTSLVVAGRVPDRVAAAMSFHGGGLAAAHDPRRPRTMALRTIGAKHGGTRLHGELFQFGVTRDSGQIGRDQSGLDGRVRLVETRDLGGHVGTGRGTQQARRGPCQHRPCRIKRAIDDGKQDGGIEGVQPPARQR